MFIDRKQYCKVPVLPIWAIDLMQYQLKDQKVILWQITTRYNHIYYNDKNKFDNTKD